MTDSLDPDRLEGLKERGWRQVAAIDAALGVFNEEIPHRALEMAVSLWGFGIAGRADCAHPDTEEPVRRAFWIDAPPR